MPEVRFPKNFCESDRSNSGLEPDHRPRCGAAEEIAFRPRLAQVGADLRPKRDLHLRPHLTTHITATSQNLKAVDAC